MAVMLDAENSSLLKVAPRLFQILRVLARHKFLGTLRGKAHLPPPKEVRETFEELGLTFLKFGQVLAMRRDLLPDAYITELEQLHDQLPALGIDAVRATVEIELGVQLTEIFAEFSETPLAAATIAQVHEAIMHDGRRVAVKVQRPDLEEMISTDIAALTYLAALVIGGAMMVNAPLPGLHHYLGESMVYLGVIGTIFVWVGLLRHDYGRGHGRR